MRVEGGVEGLGHSLTSHKGHSDLLPRSRCHFNIKIFSMTHLSFDVGLKGFCHSLSLSLSLSLSF